MANLRGSRRSGYPCRRCGGQIFFERDLLYHHVTCKCLQCGYIAAYLWIEPGQSHYGYEPAGIVSDGTLMLEDS